MYYYINPAKYIPYQLSKNITIMYDKGRDNVATLRSKLTSAYRKAKAYERDLNKDVQHLKKHKSLTITYY